MKKLEMSTKFTELLNQVSKMPNLRTIVLLFSEIQTNFMKPK